MERAALVARIWDLLQSPLQGHSVGILTTCGDDCRPHAAWMGTISCPSLQRILTMTAPESQKVQNVLQNPRVEWLFADPDKEEVVYASGTGRIVQEPEEVEKAWKEMPDKSRAYFLGYQTVGMRFLIIETAVERFEYRVPRKNQVVRLKQDELVV